MRFWDLKSLARICRKKFDFLNPEKSSQASANPTPEREGQQLKSMQCRPVEPEAQKGQDSCRTYEGGRWGFDLGHCWYKACKSRCATILAAGSHSPNSQQLPQLMLLPTWSCALCLRIGSGLQRTAWCGLSQWSKYRTEPYHLAAQRVGWWCHCEGASRTRLWGRWLGRWGILMWWWLWLLSRMSSFRSSEASMHDRAEVEEELDRLSRESKAGWVFASFANHELSAAQQTGVSKAACSIDCCMAWNDTR